MSVTAVWALQRKAFGPLGPRLAPFPRRCCAEDAILVIQVFRRHAIDLKGNVDALVFQGRRRAASLASGELFSSGPPHTPQPFKEDSEG